MSVELYQRVVLTRDIPVQDLCQGDVATVVEVHRDRSGTVLGCELEVFSASGEMLAVVSAPADAVRSPTKSARLATYSA